MTSTSISLLQRLHEDPSSDDWQRLVTAYRPMMRAWLRRQGTPDQDTDDIVQEVMSVLVRRIGEFQRQRTGSFRRWVRTITVNCMRDHLRRQRKSPRGAGGSDMVQMMGELADDTSQLSRRWDEEHAQYLLQIILDRVRVEFRPATWEAFKLVAIDKVSPQAAAQQLDLSVNAVFVAKSRVLKRIREEGAGLIEQ